MSASWTSLSVLAVELVSMSSSSSAARSCENLRIFERRSTLATLSTRMILSTLSARKAESPAAIWSHGSELVRSSANQPRAYRFATFHGSETSTSRAST